MSSSDRRLKRTRVSTMRWRTFPRRDQTDAGIDAVVAAGKKPQALPGFVEQFGLRQDAPADRHHGVGGDDEGAAQILVRPHAASAASALARARRVAQARGNSPCSGISSISAGCRASGSMPAWLISVSLRGEPEARTSLGRPIMWCAVHGVPAGWRGRA